MEYLVGLVLVNWETAFGERLLAIFFWLSASFNSSYTITIRAKLYLVSIQPAIHVGARSIGLYVILLTYYAQYPLVKKLSANHRLLYDDIRALQEQLITW
ncbi:unnamed protein product [Absidia cylindrospora]